MKRFADTFYFLALLNPRDAAHDAAMAAITDEGFIVTQWVLTEVADAMARRETRKGFVNLLRILRRNPQVEIIPVSGDLFESGVQLYAARSDKDWSLTDCISFRLMQELGLKEALTGDHHFEQAGFKALLR